MYLFIFNYCCLLGKQAVAKNSGEKIPLLETVFKAFPEHAINVDIKDNNDELIDKVQNIFNKTFCNFNDWENNLKLCTLFIELCCFLKGARINSHL